MYTKQDISFYFEKEDRETLLIPIQNAITALRKLRENLQGKCEEEFEAEIEQVRFDHNNTQLDDMHSASLINVLDYLRNLSIFINDNTVCEPKT